MPASRARRASASLLVFVLILALGGCSHNRADQPASQQRLFVTEPETSTIAVYHAGATGRATVA